MKNFEIKNESGRSMIEMLGVLAIIGVLSVGGIAGYSKAMMKYRINKTIEQITLIAGNIRAFFAPQGNYEGLSSYSDTGKAIIKKAKLVPDEMLTLDSDGKITAITNAFGGEFDIDYVNKSAEDDNKAFIFWLRNIPEEACIELASQDWSISNADIISIMNHSENWSKLEVHADMDKIIEACTDSDFFIIHFDIDKNSTYWQERTY